MLSSNFIRRATGITVLFLLAAMAGSAGAVPADEAEELMRRGNNLRRAGDDEGALPIFRRAYEVSKSPRTSAQLGLVEWALGRWVEADEHLTDALKAVATDVWIRTNRETIEEALTVAKRNVGRVEITGDPSGAEVLVNGRPVGTVPLPQPVRVIAGSVDIELRAPGYRPGFRTITIAGLQYQPVVIRLDKEGEGSSAGPAGGLRPVQRGASGLSGEGADLGEHAPMASWRKAALGVAIGAAGLSLGVASYGIWRYNDQVASFNKRMCLETTNGAILARSNVADRTCTQIKSAYKKAQTIWIAGFSAAGALGASALVLYLTAGSGDQRASAAPVGRLACAPDLIRPGLACAFPF